MGENDNIITDKKKNEETKSMVCRSMGCDWTYNWMKYDELFIAID